MALSLEYIGKIILTAVVILIGIGLIMSIFGGVENPIVEQFREQVRKLSGYIFAGGEAYNICEDFNGKSVTLEQFQALLQSIENNKCNAANVTILFSLTEEDFSRIENVIGMKRKLVVSSGQPKALGIGGLLVFGNAGPRPIKLDDIIEIKKTGFPEKDIIISVIKQGCDPYDDDCDVACSFKEGICDENCYKDEQITGEQCNIDCVDVNKNKTIDAGDYDDICDLDCYNNDNDPNHAYDPDCVKRRKDFYDNVCDPDSNGVIDGICDPDCANNTDENSPGWRICDLDCDGTPDEGNPYGLLDDECYKCDGECNNFCSPSCVKDAKKGEAGYDPDCHGKCCGDGSCDQDIGEDCSTCAKDCPPAASCGAMATSPIPPGEDAICCPGAPNADEYKCAMVPVNLSEGSECYCDAQCNDTMICTSGHCCPEGKVWNGTDCSEGTDVLIVAIKTNLEKVYSDAQLEAMEDKIDEFVNALGEDGLGGIFVYLDDDTNGIIPGGPLNPADSKNTAQIDKVIDDLIIKMKAKYLIIIGGYNSFPQYEVSVGGCRDPHYRSFQTDDIYADLDKDNMPEIPVGRIPDPNNGDMSVILNALDTYIALHKSGGLDISDYVSIIMGEPWSSGFCFVKDTFGHWCPEAGRCYLTNDVGPSTSNNREFFHLLIHGGDFVPQTFTGGGGYTLRSTDVPNLEFKNAIWMMMPCYSSFIKNKQRTSDSIPMQFLKYGGAVYFGGTLTQFGDRLQNGQCPNIIGGDSYIGTLYAMVASNFAPGVRIGDAYLAGKKEYTSIPEDSKHCHFRQLHENQIYGDPTLKIKNMW
ncbi:MAG: hypothetical protein DRQ06_04900 [Candidatus Hydrothermota bacterium]|nr:MAG: hypothetical protein DRQ06_04900 [Candidatus Hydrothermae bacterium]